MAHGERGGEELNPLQLTQQIKPIKDGISKLSGSIAQIEKTLDMLTTVSALIERFGGWQEVSEILSGSLGTRDGQKDPLARLNRLIDTLENADYEKLRQLLEHPMVQKLFSLSGANEKKEKK
ncbi:MAG: hypothetical protein IMX04_08605 [Candidatus Carbobacillus altaicus]|uniref:Uncharacterized protein n=1 Tax=Candidatus Carbonibacillus altaicus TaxID=2163959 RepID=A0A2R6Y1N9_9BACL|nr:hypothetical protein [Candidatus Carbobacillus altaicus]PTQ56596.1 MAG: hypothetical protein BSOLF_2864 [Candidatus Carbobacillus altaicus]